MRIILVVVLVLALSTIGCANAHTYTIPVPEMDGELWLEVWETSYHAEEGFTNCRLLMEENPSLTKEEAHELHTCTSNGTEPDWSTCAVDPNYIPYGSIIYSQNYEDLCGRYLIAVDSGGAINGWDLDLWVEKSAQSITGTEMVRILRWGWADSGGGEWLVDPKLWGLEP
jgi:3D (Asp-Asp-Asp) domain-containing protein